jgi:Uma2 family endonuclease
MSAVELRRWTRDEYERMIRAGIFAPEERVELIDGEIIRVSPPGPRHCTAIMLALEALRSAFGTRFQVRPQSPLALSDWSEPEPDISVVTGAPRDYRDQHPQTAVLVVEVSDSSLRLDRERKSRLYARQGIAEYWILNIRENGLEVYREPTIDGYKSIRAYERDHSIAPLGAPESPINVADLLP